MKDKYVGPLSMVERWDSLFDGPILQGNPLMLWLIFSPRLHDKGFKNTRSVGRVLVETPIHPQGTGVTITGIERERDDQVDRE